MSRSRTSRISKPRRKKGKRVRQVVGGNHLVTKVSPSRILNWAIFEMDGGQVLLEPQIVFNKAIVGLTHENQIVYSEDAIIQSMAKEWAMTLDEAAEFYEYNTLRALPYVPQEKRPVILRTPQG